MSHFVAATSSGERRIDRRIGENRPRRLCAAQNQALQRLHETEELLEQIAYSRLLMGLRVLGVSVGNSAWIALSSAVPGHDLEGQLVAARHGNARRDYGQAVCE